MKYILFFSLSVFLVISSCEEPTKKNELIFDGTNCFSVFRFGSDRGDTTRYFYAHTFLFEGDSLIILSTNPNHRNDIIKLKLSQLQKDSIKSYSIPIKFKDLIGNTSIMDAFKEMAIYCGPEFGFIDSLNRAEVYTPYTKKEDLYKPSMKLFSYLNNLKGNSTNDTIKIIQYTNLIKSKYIEVSPPPPRMGAMTKFVPPIIHDNKVETK